MTGTHNDYSKRLIEVDLSIKRISAHARREKSIWRISVSNSRCPHPGPAGLEADCEGEALRRATGRHFGCPGTRRGMN